MTRNGLGKARAIETRKGNLNSASANNQGRINKNARPERTEPQDVGAPRIENRATGTRFLTRRITVVQNCLFLHPRDNENNGGGNVVGGEKL